MSTGRRRGPVTPPAPSPRALEQAETVAAAFTALRRAYAGVLDAVHAAHTEDLAGQLGYPSTTRLLHDLARLDRGEATVVLRQARATHSDVAPSGHASPPELAETASRLAEGAISDGHVRVIAAAMTRLAGVAHLDPETLAVIETELAGLALDRTPTGLADAAAQIAARLDPDGTVPDDGSVPVDELRLLRRRDGSLHGKFRFLDPVSAEAVQTALRAATPPPSADGDPTATDRGPADLDAPPGLGGRPLEQRQAQALRDLCATSLTLGGGLDVDPDPDPDDVDHDTADLEPVPTGLDEGIEFREPSEAHDLDDLHYSTGDAAAGDAAAGDAGAGDAAADEAARDLDIGRGTATGPGAGLAQAVAGALGDPEALESLLERTISALLTTPTSPPPTSRPPAAPPPTSRRGNTRTGSPVPDTEGGERVHLAVTIDWDTLRAQLTGDSTGEPAAGASRRRGLPGQGRLPGLGHLGSGTPISPATARQLACDAELYPIILGSRSEPLDIGRKTRVVSAGIRRAVVVRDRHCAFPGCRRRPQACDVHHVQHWIFDGHTVIDNLCLLCPTHHTLIHRSHWSIAMIDGMPWFIPPRWLDIDRRARHNRPWRTDPTPALQA